MNYTATGIEELQRTNLGSNSTNTSTGVEQQLCNKSSTTKRANLKKKFVGKLRHYRWKRALCNDSSNKIADRNKDVPILSLLIPFAKIYEKTINNDKTTL